MTTLTKWQEAIFQDGLIINIYHHEIIIDKAAPELYIFADTLFISRRDMGAVTPYFRGRVYCGY